MDIPGTKYAWLGESRIAYQVVGDGSVDLVVSQSPIDVWWDHPIPARFTERLASFSRVILFDQRGTGASDPIQADAMPTWEDWAEDLVAVLEAVGSSRAAILGDTGLGAVAMLFAATYPERTSALVLVNTTARFLWAEDYVFGVTPEAFEPVRRALDRGFGTVQAAAGYFPSLANDERFLRWFAKHQRLRASPRIADAMVRHALARDVRWVLPSIGVPTLILHRRNNRYTVIEHAKYLADHIRGARLVELPGSDTQLYTEASDEILDLIEEFLTGTRRVPEADRVLATVLFTDIVGSTERAAALGDRRWKEILNAHDSLVRERIEAFRGRFVNSTGDGLLATFDGPARAVRCALAMSSEIRTLGIEMRAGLHTGEIELRGADVGGIAVHIGARVAAQAGASEVLVSRTVTELVAGSGIEFDDRGAHELKGVPGEWRLFAVRS